MDPELNPQAVLKFDARLGFPLPSNSVHLWKLDEGSHHGRRILGSNDQVKITDCFAHPAIASRSFRSDNTFEAPQPADEEIRGHRSTTQQDAPGLPFLHPLDAVQDLRLGLFAHAGELTELAPRGGGLKCGDTIDAQGLIEESSLLRSDIRDLKHVHDAWRQLGRQLVVEFKLPRSQQFIDLPCNGLAYMLDGAQLIRLPQIGDILRQLPDRFGRPPIGKDAVDGLSFDREQIGDRFEDLRNLMILHGIPPIRVALRQRSE